MSARPSKDPRNEATLEKLRQAEAMKRIEQDAATAAARAARKLHQKRQEGKSK
jgi:hypothetical protein